ncbi:MFS superfamily sulfate permease-like transporter [Lacibacter cauensis]|uniref:MFS superfamily sulfate permease-like transporter n=1 Tax=Lacibacter cauensis TaxID=510947 RepID=A0A562SK04_9BACT|nr:SulP family inorganic anion transporter [Lacibacter cauensis]TWI81591.1 MFS superfamily sulfate permease-like transporter [Lacibacter cauensis]
MKLETKYFKTDLLAGLVVFLVALPLCLGIALASGAPLFSGIITGVIGGIVVGFLSGSNLSVTGPAAGLTAIVLAGITSVGSYELFLLAVVIAGGIQLLLGIIKAGTISNYFPSNVIEGMLTGIGIIIILKQIPHAVGYDKDSEGDFAFIENNTGHNTLTAITDAINSIHYGAIIITIVCIGILIAFNKVSFLKRIKLIPGGLVAVIAGVLINELFIASGSILAVQKEHLVNLPIPGSFNEFIGQFSLPDFKGLSNSSVWILGATIAVVASIETLLCLEAADKMDPLKRYSNGNTELRAQGIGNILAGLIGGLPMTSVIVRTSANINSGGRTKLATIAHGLFLLLAVVAIPTVLNKIPLAALAAILIMIGLKLASPKVFKHMWHNGKFQFIPFIITVLAVVFTDLLKGVGIGLVVSILFILRGNMKLAYFFRKDRHREGEQIKIKLAQEVSFLNKAAIKQTLVHLPHNSRVLIDASETVYIDHDVLELIKDFVEFTSTEKNIKVDLVGFKGAYKIENTVSHVNDADEQLEKEVL